MMAHPDQPVFIVEGEKCAAAVRGIGGVATTAHGGWKEMAPELNKYFTGRDVVILPDQDAAGEAHADMVAQNLHGHVNTIKRVNLPGLQDKQDVYDWLSNGGTADELVSLVGAAQPVVFNQVNWKKPTQYIVTTKWLTALTPLMCTTLPTCGTCRRSSS